MRENVAEGDCPYCGVEPAAEKRNVSSLPDPAVHESQTGHLLREHRTPTVPSPSQPVRQVANKPNKRRRILLPILISLAALLLCVGIFLSTQFFGSSVHVTEATSSILYADQTMLPVGESIQVHFTVRTTDQTVEELTIYENDDAVCHLTETRTEGFARYFEGSAALEKSRPTQAIYTARSTPGELASLILRFAPEVTDQMVENAEKILDDLAATEADAFPGGDPDESFLPEIYRYLLDDSRVKQVAQDQSGVSFITADGLGCRYTLPPEEGTFGLKPQLTQPSEGAFQTSRGELLERVYAAENIYKADYSDLYVQNSYNPTNDNVLFLQSYDGITSAIINEDVQEFFDPVDFSKKRFHEDFCEKIADFRAGEFDTKRDVNFLASMFDGSWCNYGTILMNTHGAVQVFRHAKDGSSATAFLVTNNTEYKKYESWRAQRQYLFADYNNGKLSNKYDDTFSLSPLFMNQDHDLWASTDLIMDQYGDKMFDNTVFLFNVCYMMRDGAFKKFLFDHGAQVIVGSPKSINMSFSRSWLNKLAKVWTKYDEGDSHSSYLSDGFDDSEHLANNVFEVYMRTQIDGHSAFSYYGHSDMKGKILVDGDRSTTTDDKPAEGAKVIACPYYNHRLHRNPDLFTTASEAAVVVQPDGSFTLTYQDWGTYILKIEYEGQVTYAQGNFHGGSCGTIYVDNIPEEFIPLRSPKPTPEAPTPTPEPSDTPDYYGLLRSYLREVLVPQYGVMPVKRQVYGCEYQDTALQNTDNLHGILSGEITDLDGDGQEELLVYRFADCTERYAGGEDMPATEIHIEVYETDGASCFPADSVTLTDTGYRSNHHDLRSALFLCNAGDYTGITLYGCIHMNSTHEVIRQYRYDGSALSLMLCEGTAVGGGPCSTSHYRLTNGEDLSGTYGGFGGHDGWEIVDIADEESHGSGYKTADQEILARYADVLRSYGMERTGRRFQWFGELYDYDREEKYSVRDAFSNSDNLHWIGELDTCYQFIDSPQKVVIPKDYTGLAR